MDYHSAFNFRGVGNSWLLISNTEIRKWIKQLNPKFRYEIKFYLVWNIDAFKENHRIVYGEVLVREKYSNNLHIF